ncbi:MAG: HAD-IC family P-type ATPase [Planctomycetota bacterium]
MLPVAVSVLVVTCPCALGIAIPLAFDLALARLRRHGIFVRTPELLEKARGWRRVFFDKTGTLTWGGLRAHRDVAPDPRSLDLLYTMTASSRHPVSRAIHVDLEGGRFRPGLEVRERIGKGLEVEDGGRLWRLGRPAWALGRADGEDGRRTVLGRDGVLAGSWRLDEDFRPGFEEELRALEEDGIEVHVVSGDHEDKVRRAAARLGLAEDRVRGDLSPAEKAAYVEARGAADGLMVGDGLNDAPAFRVAGSTATPALDRPVLPSQADFYYVGSGADAVRRVRETGARLRRVVRRDLVFAALYNLGALVLCFAGLMTPLLCAVLMPLSSLALLAVTLAGFQGWGSAGVRNEAGRWT